MIKSLYNAQSGFLDIYKFKELEITKRCYSLHLSRHQDVESVHTSAINSLDIEKSENRYLLSGCSDGSIYIHDINNLTGKPQYTAKCVGKVCKTNQYSHRCSVECVSWYRDDSALFITSGTDKTLKIWDANSLKYIEQYFSKGRIFHHECSSIPTSNPVIAVASSLNFIELIDLRTGNSIHELRGHKSSILACSWSPVDDHILASGGIDKCIYIWDIRSSNSCLKALVRSGQTDISGSAHSGYVNGLKFTSDGLFLVSIGTDNKIRIWEMLNRGCSKTQSCIKLKNDIKKNVQFAISDNSNPSLLYVPSEGNILVVEMVTGTVVNILHGHFHLVNCCFYRNTFHELYSGGNDRNVLLWTADEPQEDKCNENYKLRTRDSNKSISIKADAWSSDED